MNTSIVYAKKAKKREKRQISKQEKKKGKKLVKSSPPYFYSSFLKSWLIEPSENYMPRVLMTLAPYNLSFKDRYSRVLYFNKLNELEKIFFDKKVVSNPAIKYSDTQFDCLMAFRKNQALRWSFKKLLLAWKIRKFEVVNDTDIITMEPFKNPVHIFDYKTKKQYTIEAKSLLVDSINRFLIHDDFFPKSKAPRNLYTNEELTFSQLWSISNQLRKYGVTHWCWEAFVKSEFSLSRLLSDHDIPMKYEMIKRCFDDKTSSDAKWFTSELVLANTEGLTARSLKWAIYNRDTHSYILKWRNLCQLYWRVAVLKGELQAENTEWIQTHISNLLNDELALREIKGLYFETKTL